ncbi:MAG: hypothetical protein M1823_007034, partial [Watsoniomyces obsoletus]
DLGDGVAGGMPGDRGGGEIEFASELIADSEARVRRVGGGAEGSERSSCAAELDLQDAGEELGEALGVSVQGGEVDGTLVAEGARKGVLEVCAGGHGVELAFDDAEAGLDLEDGGGVHYVLGCSPPMDVV